MQTKFFFMQVAFVKELLSKTTLSFTFYLLLFTIYSNTANAQFGATKYGDHALYNNTTTGIYNTGLGYYSLYANTTGTKNTAVGANVLRANNGSYNTGVGYASLYQNTSGHR